MSSRRSGNIPVTLGWRHKAPGPLRALMPALIPWYCSDAASCHQQASARLRGGDGLAFPISVPCR